MNNYIRIESFIESEEVTFYSVKIGIEESDFDEIEFETDKFFAKFSDLENKFYSEFEVIIALIEEMGKRGAKRHYFRHERRADALPSKPNAVRNITVVKHSKLRLYCLRLSDTCVILCNGGVKTKDLPQDCKNVHAHFNFVNKLAKAIDTGLVNGDVKLVDRLLELEYGELEI